MYKCDFARQACEPPSRQNACRRIVNGEKSPNKRCTVHNESLGMRLKTSIPFSIHKQWMQSSTLTFLQKPRSLSTCLEDQKPYNNSQSSPSKTTAFDICKHLSITITTIDIIWYIRDTLEAFRSWVRTATVLGIQYIMQPNLAAFMQTRNETQRR